MNTKTKTKTPLIRAMPRAALEQVRGGEDTLVTPAPDDPTTITQPLEFKLIYNRAS